jgi:hypothetical protein
LRPGDEQLLGTLADRLRSFDGNVRRLPGVARDANRNAFIEQLLESIRRVRYVSVIRQREVSAFRGEPASELFDPIKAAVLRMTEGRRDEAFWFVFISVHFGKHRRDGWRLARDVYGRLGRGAPWDWATTSANPRRFRQWLADAQEALTEDGVKRRFGNHRKYQSLGAWNPNGTGDAFESYVRWVGPERSHDRLVEEALDESGRESRMAFDILYRSMAAVSSFGRTARFDYLTMLGKLELAPIEPGSVYIQGATGPWLGACLLFRGRKDADLRRPMLSDWVSELGAHLGVGMQVMEDALCNWQKNPSRFIPFRG